VIVIFNSNCISIFKHWSAHSKEITHFNKTIELRETGVLYRHILCPYCTF